MATVLLLAGNVDAQTHITFATADSERDSSLRHLEPKKRQMSGIYIWESCSPLYKPPYLDLWQANHVLFKTLQQSLHSFVNIDLEN